MVPSTSVCNILNSKPLTEIALLIWLQIGLGPAYRWRHRHGAAIDDTTRIQFYWTF
jgi:hypothetical protein